MKMEKIKAKFKNKKFALRFILLSLCIVALIAAAVYTVFIQPLLQQDKYIYKEDTVVRGDMVIGITESGTLELGESSIVYDLTIETDEDEDDDSSDDDDDDEEDTIHYLQIEEVEVASGQRIMAGDPLFKLTQDSVKAVRKILTSNLTEAQITLSEAKTDYNTSELSARSTRDSSNVESANAGTTYSAAMVKINNEVAGYQANIKVYEQQIVELQEDLADEDMREDYADSIIAYNSAKTKYEETDLHNVDAYTSNYSAYVSAKTTMENYEAQISTMEEELETLQRSITDANEAIVISKNSYAKEAADANHDYDTAALNGELADNIYEYSTSTLEEAVSTAQTIQTEAEEALQAFEDFVGTDGIIYAEEDGLVTAVNYSEEDELTQTGTLLTYTIEDSYTISIDVSEEDIPYLTVGDSVDVLFTAYSDTPYEGKISAITTTSTSESTATVSYPVTIQVLGDTTPLYGGMTADVTFITDSKEDSLYLSKKAIVTQNDQTFVYQKNSMGNMELIPVETGFSNSTSIEIISGLEEGDVVYIASKISSDQDENALMDTSTENSDTAEDGSVAMPDGSSMTMPDGSSMTMPDGSSMSMPNNGDMTMPEGSR